MSQLEGQVLKKILKQQRPTVAPILRNRKKGRRGEKEGEKKKNREKGMEVREKESQVWNKILF